MEFIVLEVGGIKSLSFDEVVVDEILGLIGSDEFLKVEV